jgi:histidyl-tRNA synthetase
LEAPKPLLDAYAVIPDIASMPRAMTVVQLLRGQGLSVQMQASTISAEGAVAMPSFKAQFKRADASGAHYALIFGTDELADNSVSVKPLMGGEQKTFPLSELSRLISFLKH